MKKFIQFWSLGILLFISLSEAQSQTIPAQNLTEIRFESQRIISESLTQSYYLTESFEADRVHFRLFQSDNQALQDLVWEKSFRHSSSLNTQDGHSPIARWLQKVIHDYDLKKVPANAPEEGNFIVPRFQGTQSWMATEKLWTPENTWNQDWENQYADWVSKTLTPQWMIELQLPTDCADVAYTLRWIFARIHKLPMAVRLGGSGQLFTHETMKAEWARLPSDEDWKKDRRFRAALEFILRNTYTHTLMGDSYPVSLKPTELTPGTHHLNLFGPSGHTMLVHSVNAPGEMPITLLYSTTPIQVRELIATFYQSYETPELFRSGFYKIRWTHKTRKGWELLPARQQPGYSLEQFELKGDEGSDGKPYFLKVYQRLNPEFSFGLMLEKSYSELQDRIRDRMHVVEEGYEFCRTQDCAPGSMGDEDWSTPSRDRRILQIHSSLNLAAEFLEQTDQPLFRQWQDRLQNEVKQKIYRIENQDYSLTQILLALLHQLAQPDPRLVIAQRWGVSFEGYTAQLAQATHTTLLSRKTLIQKAESCRKNHCDELSADFKKFHTDALDTVLVNQWLGAQKLCQWTQNQDCLKMRERLQAQSFENSSLLEHLEKSPIWISNPNASMNFRWGQHGTAIATRSLTSKAFFSADRQWFTLDHKLIQTSNLQAVELFNEETLGQLHPGKNLYFTYIQQNTSLVLQIYEPPHKEQYSFSLTIPPNSPLRIWWSGPEKESLIVFSNEQALEVDKRGQVLQKIPLISFTVSPADPRLTFFKTSKGNFLNDSAQKGDTFFPMPLPPEEMILFSQVLRTNRGWGFIGTKTNRLIYFETPSTSTSNPILLDWTLGPNSLATVTADGEWALKITEEPKGIQFYKRNRANTGLINFEPYRFFRGEWFSITGAFITIYEGLNANLFSLKDLKLQSLNCQAPNLHIQMLSDNYYSCSDSTRRELHSLSGTLVATEENFDGSWWVFERGGQTWLRNFHWSRGSSLNYSEVFQVSSKGLIGPVLQEPTEMFVRFSLNANIPGSDNQPLTVAPEALGPWELTNFGLTHSVRSPKSFLLKASAPQTEPMQYLFLPKL